MQNRIIFHKTFFIKLIIFSLLSFLVYSSYKILNNQKKILLDITKREPSSTYQCDLFSESLGICNKSCTLTSCESTSTIELIKGITPNMKALEIGPYITPTLKGNNVKYFDVLNTEQIKEQVLNEKDPDIRNHVQNDADLSKTPYIDYVDSTGNLGVIKEKFEAVFSSHNIEHQIDLIRHLNQVADLLEEGGKFYLVIPDKRYCYDHFIPESALSDIIDQYMSGPRTNHSLKTVLAMHCETTHNHAALHWEKNHGQIKGRNLYCYNEAIEEFNSSKGKYINSHRWRFTPQQFEFIINSLYEMKLVKLKVEKVYITAKNDLQFHAILYKPS